MIDLDINNGRVDSKTDENYNFPNMIDLSNTEYIAKSLNEDKERNSHVKSKNSDNGEHIKSTKKKESDISNADPDKKENIRYVSIFNPNSGQGQSQGLNVNGKKSNLMVNTNTTLMKDIEQVSFI